MKRLVILILLLFFALPCYAQDPDGILGRTSIAELKSIPGSQMKDGLFAVVVLDQDPTYGSIVLHYAARASGMAESLLNVVTPTTAAGSWRWHRIKIYTEVADLDIMTTGATPTVADTAKISHKTSGSTFFGNTGSSAILGKDTSNNTFVFGRKYNAIQIPFISPHTFPTATRDKWLAFINPTNLTMRISRIFCTATTATSITFKSTTAWNDWTILNTIGTVSIVNANTGGGYRGDTTTGLANAYLGAGRTLIVDFHDTDVVESGHCLIEGWYDAS